MTKKLLSVVLTHLKNIFIKNLKKKFSVKKSFLNTKLSFLLCKFWLEVKFDPSSDDAEKL